MRSMGPFPRRPPSPSRTPELESLPHIRAKLESLDELSDLVGALRALAAIQSREALAALDGTTRYTRIIENSIAWAASLLPAPQGTAQPPRPARKDILVVVCSENGFVGSFNERLIEQAAKDRHDGEGLILVGRQGGIKATERNIEPAQNFPMTTHIHGVPDTARQVCDALSSAGRVRLIFARYRQGASYEIVTKRILPLAMDLLTGARPILPPLHHLSPEDLLAQLASEYLYAEMSHGMMESLASENGARLQTMESADESIDRKLDKLRGEERTLRQQQITEELIDVVTGAEATKEKRTKTVL